ncbi:MAG TPA: hypothetical protein VGD58_08510 [Herpetosiphonaceae bacterium]
MKAYTATDFQTDMRGRDPRMIELAYLQAHLDAIDDVLAQSQPLAGIVFTEQGPMEVSQASAAFGVEAVLYRFGTWAVTGDGVACLVRHYPLSHAQLQEQQDWVSYLAEQGWVNLWDLLRALKIAEHIRSRRQQGGPQGQESHPS